MFSVKGRLRLDPGGPETEVVWIAGRCFGDDRTLLVIEGIVADAEGDRVGPQEGPYTRTNHMSSDLSAFILVTQAFESGWEGELVIPEPPPTFA